MRPVRTLKRQSPPLSFPFQQAKTGAPGVPVSREHGEEVPGRIDRSKPRQRAKNDGADDGQAGQRGSRDAVRGHACGKRHMREREEEEEVLDEVEQEADVEHGGRAWSRWRHRDCASVSTTYSGPEEGVGGQEED